MDLLMGAVFRRISQYLFRYNVVMPIDDDTVTRVWNRRALEGESDLVQPPAPLADIPRNLVNRLQRLSSHLTLRTSISALRCRRTVTISRISRCLQLDHPNQTICHPSRRLPLLNRCLAILNSYPQLLLLDHHLNRLTDCLRVSCHRVYHLAVARPTPCLLVQLLYLYTDQTLSQKSYTAEVLCEDIVSEEAVAVVGAAAILRYLIRLPVPPILYIVLRAIQLARAVVSEVPLTLANILVC
jgi:hypothetical protein